MNGPGLKAHEKLCTWENVTADFFKYLSHIQYLSYFCLYVCHVSLPKKYNELKTGKDKY